MKNKQRILALLTSLGLTASLSACNSGKEDPSNYVNDSTVCEAQDTHAKENTYVNKVIDDINKSGNYEVKLNGTKLMIKQLVEGSDVDYDLLRYIMDVIGVDDISIGIKDSSISFEKLFKDKSGMSVALYEVDTLTDEQANKLCEDIKNIDGKLKYIIYKSRVVPSTIKIANSIGYLNGSLSIRCGANDLDIVTLLNSLDTTCRFASVEILAGKKAIGSSLKNVNANSLTLYLDLGEIDAIEVNPSVKELNIIDDAEDEVDYQYGHEVRVTSSTDKRLIRGVVHVERPIYIDFGPDVEKIINVSSKEIAELYIERGFAFCESGVINISEDYSTLLINDGVDYIDNDTKAITHYSADEFSVATLYSSDVERKNLL